MRRRSWQWGAFFACCLLPALACAFWKPLTSDELFTYEIAQLGSLSEVWRAMLSGADFHPPLDFILRHYSMALLGKSELAFRFPSILETWVTLACLFAFVSRRTSPLYGLIAMLIPLSTPVFEFSYEGRAYALVVACAAGALVSWQRRTEGSRSALLFLALSLATGVWAHYYGLLAFGPIALGELVRSRHTRRLDWGVWGALAAATAALIPLLPFIRGARQAGAAYWTKVGLLQAVSIYSTLMERLCICAAAVIAVLLVTGLLRRARGGELRPPAYEIAAVVGLMLLPIAAYILAKTATGALVPRYVLATTVGISIALAYAAWEALGASTACGVIIAAALGVSAAGGEVAFAWKQRQLAREMSRSNLTEAIAGLPGPIVMTDNDLLMQLWHYERPEIVKRLVFVTDMKAAVEIQGYNTIELLFPRLQPWSQRVRVEPYARFIEEHPRFVLVDTLRGYVAKLLLRDGARITAKGAYRDKWVFEVEQGTRLAAAQ